MFVSVMLIAMLIWFITTLLVYEIKNNGDKFYCRKSMWAADKILIINELGPYARRSTQVCSSIFYNTLLTNPPAL